MKRKGLAVFAAAGIFIITANISPPVAAAETADIPDNGDTAAIIENIYHSSGADRLESALPDEADELLKDIGFRGFSPGGLDDVTAEGAFTAIGRLLRSNITEPLRVLSCLLGIVVISAALETVKCGGAADNVLSLVTSLCAASVIAPPLLELSDSLSNVIEGASGFMTLYVPVISGLIIASGKAAEGSAYCAAMVFFSSTVAQLSAKAVVPLLKCVMSLCVVSSASSVDLNGVISLFRRVARFVLTFCMSLFVAFLTMRSIVAAAADSLSNRAAKFAIGSFVPVVGGTLSEAYQTVVGCVGLLKSGVGAAAIAAAFAIFIPAAVRCIVWQAVSAIGSAVCGLFGVTKVSSLLDNMSAVASVIFAVLMCVMVTYMVSTAIVIIVGG